MSKKNLKYKNSVLNIESNDCARRALSTLISSKEISSEPSCAVVPSDLTWCNITYHYVIL